MSTEKAIESEQRTAKQAQIAKSPRGEWREGKHKTNLDRGIEDPGGGEQKQKKLEDLLQEQKRHKCAMDWQQANNRQTKTVQ